MSSTHGSHTVLIVDDNERLRKGLARSLRGKGCRTLTAASGEEALTLLKGRKVDLIITDLVMPGMDGMTLARNIRSTVPSTKIVIITAYGSTESRQEAEELGVACYLAKPFDLSDLKSRVDELLAGKDEVRQTLGAAGTSGSSAGRTEGAERFMLHPSPFIPRCIGTACGKTLRAAVDLSRKARPYVRPTNVMRAVVLAVGKSIGRAAAATSGLARRSCCAASRFAEQCGGLASVFTRSGQLRCPDDQERPGPPGAAKKEAKRE